MADLAARMRLVDEHVACENRHDLDGVLATFGVGAMYEDAPWSERHEGRDGVRAYYESLLAAMPDLRIEVLRRVASAEAIVLEVVIHGTHLGAWRGLSPTGRTLAFPLCGIYTFDADDRLVGERIYYDRATVLQQIGALSHPLRLVGAYFRTWRDKRRAVRQATMNA